jgi:hypothetical protein
LGAAKSIISEIPKLFSALASIWNGLPDQPGGCSSLLRSHPSRFFDAFVPLVFCALSRELSSVWSRDAPDFRGILDLSAMTVSLRWQKDAPGKARSKVTTC